MNHLFDFPCFETWVANDCIFRSSINLFNCCIVKHKAVDGIERFTAAIAEINDPLDAEVNRIFAWDYFSSSITEDNLRAWFDAAVEGLLLACTRCKSADEEVTYSDFMNMCR